MTIPIFRHNQDHDDWEVASVYDSDDCGSLGRSACDEPLHSLRSFDRPASHLQGHLYDESRLHVRYSVPQRQPQNYPPATFARPQWDARYVPGNQSNFIVPPPGVIFPSKDRLPSPQDTLWSRTPGQTTPTSGRLLDANLAESPPPSLLLSPSSPPHASSSLIKLPTPTMAIVHGQLPHATSVTLSGTGTGTNVNTHASPPPPRYHEVAPSNLPRLADAGCQAHPGMEMSPPRRSGHDISTTQYPPGPGHVSRSPRGAPSSKELTVVDGRTGYGLRDRPDLQHPLVGSKYEYEREQDYGYGVIGQGGTASRPPTRERRPSLWRRFARRFGPSRVSVRQT